MISEIKWNLEDSPRTIKIHDSREIANNFGVVLLWSGLCQDFVNG